MYWPINQIPQSYPVLLGWWADQNLQGRHLWPGINIGRVLGAEGADEAVNQIMVTRGMVSGGPGNVHWSIGPLLENPYLVEALADGPSQHDALVPAMPWIDRDSPAAPRASIEGSGAGQRVTWTHPNPGDVAWWVVYVRTGGEWRHRVFPGDRRSVPLTPSTFSSDPGRGGAGLRFDEVAVSAVDRSGNESRLATAGGS